MTAKALRLVINVDGWLIVHSVIEFLIGVEVDC